MQIKTICLIKGSREKPQREFMAEQDFKTTRNPGAEWRNESGDGPLVVHNSVNAAELRWLFSQRNATHNATQRNFERS